MAKNLITIGADIKNALNAITALTKRVNELDKAVAASEKTNKTASKTSKESANANNAEASAVKKATTAHKSKAKALTEEEKAQKALQEMNRRTVLGLSRYAKTSRELVKSLRSIGTTKAEFKAVSDAIRKSGLSLDKFYESTIKTNGAATKQALIVKSLAMKYNELTATKMQALAASQKQIEENRKLNLQVQKNAALVNEGTVSLKKYLTAMGSSHLIRQATESLKKNFKTVQEARDAYGQLTKSASAARMAIEAALRTFEKKAAQRAAARAEALNASLMKTQKVVHPLIRNIKRYTDYLRRLSSESGRAKGILYKFAKGLDMTAVAAVKASAGIKTLTGRMKMLAATAKSRVGSMVGGLEGFGVRLKSIGSAITTVRTALFTLSVVSGMVFGPMIKQGMAFEKTMSSVKAVVDDLKTDSKEAANGFKLTAEEIRNAGGEANAIFAEMNTRAKELGATTRYTASEVAEAMRFLGVAGFEAKQVFDGVESTLTLAAAGEVDLATAAELAADSINAFKLSAQDVNRVADVLAQTAASSNTTVDKLQESFKYAASVGASTGQSIEQVSIALGAMANSGIKATLAGTGLSQVMIKLVKGGKNVRMVAKKYGIELDRINPTMVSIIDIIKVFKEEAVSAGDVMDMFGVRAGRALMTLVNTSSDTLNTLSEKINNSFGVALEQAAIRLDNVSGAFTILKSRFETLNIEIFEAIKEDLREWIEWAQDAITITIEWVKANKELVASYAEMGIKILAIVAPLTALVAVLGNLISAMGSILSLITPIISGLSEITGITAAWAAAGTGLVAKITAIGSALMSLTGWLAPLVAIGTLIYENWEDFTDLIQQSWSSVIKPIFMMFIAAIKGIWDNISTGWAFLSKAFGGMVRSVTKLVAAFKPLFLLLKPLGYLLGTVLGQAFNVLGYAIGGVMDLISKLADLVSYLLSPLTNLARAFGLIKDKYSDLNKSTDDFVKRSKAILKALESEEDQANKTAVALNKKNKAERGDIDPDDAEGTKSALGLSEGASKERVLEGLAGDVEGFDEGSTSFKQLEAATALVKKRFGDVLENRENEVYAILRDQFTYTKESTRKLAKHLVRGSAETAAYVENLLLTKATRRTDTPFRSLRSSFSPIGLHQDGSYAGETNDFLRELRGASGRGMQGNDYADVVGSAEERLGQTVAVEKKTGERLEDAKELSRNLKDRIKNTQTLIGLLERKSTLAEVEMRDLSKLHGMYEDGNLLSIEGLRKSTAELDKLLEKLKKGQEALNKAGKRDRELDATIAALEGMGSVITQNIGRYEDLFATMRLGKGADFDKVLGKAVDAKAQETAAAVTYNKNLNEEKEIKQQLNSLESKRADISEEATDQLLSDSDKKLAAMEREREAKVEALELERTLLLRQEVIRKEQLDADIKREQAAASAALDRGDTTEHLSRMQTMASLRENYNRDSEKSAERLVEIKKTLDNVEAEAHVKRMGEIQAEADRKSQALKKEQIEKEKLHKEELKRIKDLQDREENRQSLILRAAVIRMKKEGRLYKAQQFQNIQDTMAFERQMKTAFSTEGLTPEQAARVQKQAKAFRQEFKLTQGERLRAAKDKQQGVRETPSMLEKEADLQRDITSQIAEQVNSVEDMLMLYVAIARVRDMQERRALQGARDLANTEMKVINLRKRAAAAPGNEGIERQLFLAEREYQAKQPLARARYNQAGATMQEGGAANLQAAIDVLGGNQDANAQNVRIMGGEAGQALAGSLPSPLPVKVVNTGEIKASIPEAGDAPAAGPPSAIEKTAQAAAGASPPPAGAAPNGSAAAGAPPAGAGAGAAPNGSAAAGAPPAQAAAAPAQAPVQAIAQAAPAAPAPAAGGLGGLGNIAGLRKFDQMRRGGRRMPAAMGKGRFLAPRAQSRISGLEDWNKGPRGAKGGKKAVEQKAVSGRRQNKADIADMYKLGGFDNKELNQTQFSSLAARTFGNRAVSREELFGLYEKEAARQANVKKGFQLQREAGASMTAEAAGVGFGALGSGDIADKLDQADELLAGRKTNRAEDASFDLRNRLQREADYAEKGAEVAEQVKANEEREKAKLQNTRNLQNYQEETKTRALYEDRLMPADGIENKITNAITPPVDRLGEVLDSGVASLSEKLNMGFQNVISALSNLSVSLASATPAPAAAVGGMTTTTNSKIAHININGPVGPQEVQTAQMTAQMFNQAMYY